MKKVDEINRKSKYSIKVIILATLYMIIIGIISFAIKPFNMLTYFNNKENLLELVYIVPTVLFFLICHEFIHIALFVYYGKGEAKIKVKKEERLRAIVIHQINEDVFYSKKEIVVILLSPLIIINIFFMFLMYYGNMSFLFFWNIIMNTLGSSIDIYISLFLLTKFNSNIKVNFDKDSINMNIYTL